jgi:retron-type reverse transcriptase
MEEGQWAEAEMGTPQGAVISPLLANIYLHDVFDLWVDVWRKKCTHGDVIYGIAFSSRSKLENESPGQGA